MIIKNAFVMLFMTLMLLPGAASAAKNYYGATDEDSSLRNDYRQLACDRAASTLPMYEAKMKEVCGANPHSTWCESYKDLFHSWSHVRKNNCGLRPKSVF